MVSLSLSLPLSLDVCTPVVPHFLHIFIYEIMLNNYYFAVFLYVNQIINFVIFF